MTNENPESPDTGQQMQALRQQELTQNGALARDMLFVLEHPQNPDGSLSADTATSLIVNLGQVLDEPGKILAFMSFVPPHGPGSGQRLKARMHLFLPVRQAELVVLMEADKDPQAAVLFFDGTSQPLDDLALKELSVIQRLRAVRQAMEGVGDPMSPEAQLAMIREAAAQDPAYPLLTDLIGIWAKSTGQLEDGVALLRELTAPQPLAARRVLADLLDEMEQHEEALALAHEALELDKTDLESLHLVGFLERRAGQAEQARETLLRVLAEDPDFERAYGNLTATLLDLGEHEEALRQVAAASARFGLESEPTRRLNDGAAADLLARVPPHEAEPLLARYVTRTPGVLHALAGAYADLEATAAALERLEEALAMDPADARAHYNIGVLSEEPEELLRRCQQALKHDPTYQQARATLPQALAAVHGRDQALVAASPTLCATFMGTKGREITVTDMPMTYELVFSHLWESDAVLDLANDEHLLRLLACKGHNRRFETGEEEKFMEILVREKPGEDVLAFAGAVAWATPGADEVLSAPVAITLVDETGEQREPLVSPHDTVLQLHRTLPQEPDTADTFAWPF